MTAMMCPSHLESGLILALTGSRPEIARHNGHSVKGGGRESYF